MDELRADCGLEHHEWVQCPTCIFSGLCACAGAPCCKRELDEVEK